MWLWWWERIKFRSLQKEHRFIRYKSYNELRDREKRLLYAWELYKDGASQADASSCATTSSLHWIEDQLTCTFGYTEGSIIE